MGLRPFKTPTSRDLLKAAEVRQAFTKAAKILHQGIVARYLAARNYRGKAWAKVRQATIDIFNRDKRRPGKHRGKTGQATGELLAEISARAFREVVQHSKGYSIILGRRLSARNKMVAIVFQTPHPSVIFGHPSGRITPGREFMGNTKAEQRKADSIIINAMDKALLKQTKPRRLYEKRRIVINVPL